MSVPELSEYYRGERQKKYDLRVPLKGMKFRKILHPIFVCVVALDRVIKKQTFTILSDKRIKADRPAVYACTHIGYDDIEIVCEAIKSHTYIFLGDPKSLYKDPAGLLLYLNGAVFVELNSKRDRKIATGTAKDILENNANLLIFPEGAWNITESTPVMKLFSGAAAMAIETGTDIIPVAIEQYGKHFIVNIGENMDCTAFQPEQIKQVTNELRNRLCALK